MKLSRFCAKCGAVFSEDDIIPDNFICKNCNFDDSSEFFKESVIFPKKRSTLHICHMCNAFAIEIDEKKYQWEFKKEDQSDVDFLSNLFLKNYFSKLEKKLEMEYEMYLPQNLNLANEEELKIDALIKGVQNTVEVEKEIEIQKIHTTCVYCGKILGDRHDATLQFRIFNSRDEPILKDIVGKCVEIAKNERLNNVEHFITKLSEEKNGYDLKLSSLYLLRKLSNFIGPQYNFHLIQSKKLAGINQEKGRELYRHNIVLKLLPVRKKDTIILDNSELVVEKIVKNRVILKELKSGDHVNINFDQFWKKNWRFKD